TTRHRGGGEKRNYRIVDFKRDKDGIPAKVTAIEYDPNRSARLALIVYRDGEKRYIIAPNDLRVGDPVISGPDAEARVGNCLPLEHIPTGTQIHGIELQPDAGRSSCAPRVARRSSSRRKANTRRSACHQ